MYDAFLGGMLGASVRLSEDSRYCRVSAVWTGGFACRPSLRTSTYIRLYADFTLPRPALH